MGLIVIGGLLVLIVVAEILARLGLGLGDPPLWQADPEIEYLPRPSQSCRRFGNRISYNAFCMRSRDFPRVKSDATETRVLVVGDSIVNGGSRTDQEALATALLERRLAEALDRPVVIGNISAASWGPPNVLAYFRRFGLFDADLVVIVVNSRDYADAPTFEPLDARRPQRRPLLAIQELFGKYVPRVVGRGLGTRRRSETVLPAAVEACANALRDIARLVLDSGASVVVAQHLKRCELEGEPEVGHHEIARVARELGIQPVQLGPGFAAALREGADPYRDGNHPNERGQRVIADLLFEPVSEALATRAR
jgi:hypothetical protein